MICNHLQLQLCQQAVLIHVILLRKPTAARPSLLLLLLTGWRLLLQLLLLRRLLRGLSPRLLLLPGTWRHSSWRKPALGAPQGLHGRMWPLRHRASVDGGEGAGPMVRSGLKRQAAMSGAAGPGGRLAGTTGCRLLRLSPVRWRRLKARSLGSPEGRRLLRRRLGGALRIARLVRCARWGPDGALAVAGQLHILLLLLARPLVPAVLCQAVRVPALGSAVPALQQPCRSAGMSGWQMSAVPHVGCPTSRSAALWLAAPAAPQQPVPVHQFQTSPGSKLPALIQQPYPTPPKCMRLN